jgi:beta-galactosidase GanA
MSDKITKAATALHEQIIKKGEPGLISVTHGADRIIVYWDKSAKKPNITPSIKGVPVEVMRIGRPKPATA